MGVRKERGLKGIGEEEIEKMKKGIKKQRCEKGRKEEEQGQMEVTRTSQYWT